MINKQKQHTPMWRKQTTTTLLRILPSTPIFALLRRALSRCNIGPPTAATGVYRGSIYQLLLSPAKQDCHAIPTLSPPIVRNSGNPV